MKKRIFLSFFILSFFLLLICGAMMGILSTKLSIDSIRNELALTNDLIARDLKEGYNFKDLGEKYASLGRVTLLDHQGEVLFDSSAGDVSVSHLNRPEVIDALNSGYGESIRYSQTTATYYLYVAKNQGDTLIRLAYPIQSLSGIFYNILIYTFASFGITLLISLLISYGCLNLTCDRLNSLKPILKAFIIILKRESWLFHSYQMNIVP